MTAAQSRARQKGQTGQRQLLAPFVGAVMQQFASDGTKSGRAAGIAKWTWMTRLRRPATTKSKERALLWIKALHTLIRAVLAGSILAIPAVSQFGDLRWAAGLSVAVWVEIGVLAVNGMRCPLTDLAVGYADEQSDNFDIFLPAWLARHNKLIFGSIFAAVELFLLWKWLLFLG